MVGTSMLRNALQWRPGSIFACRTMQVNRRDIFITGIDTDIGKTLVSAIFVQALLYDYWKPIQCGNLESSDTKTVLELISNQKLRVHKESYTFIKAASPHIAAKPNQIEFDQIKRPLTTRPLIIEGAGSLLVPLNETYYIVDIIQKLSCRTVVVSKNYIGSIHHTLAVLEILRHRNLPILGLVFNGVHEPEIENSILERSKLPKLLHVFPEQEINKQVVAKYASQILKSGILKPFDV